MSKKPAPAPAPEPSKTPGTAVATVDPNASMALALPEEDMAMLAADAGKGSEAVTQQDKMIPFARIVQSLSPQRQKAKPEYIEGAEEGDVFNTMNGTVYKGGDGIMFVPVAYQRQYTEWWPRESKQGKGLVKAWGPDASALVGTKKNDRGQDVTKDGTIITTSGDFFGFLLRVQWVPDEDGVMQPQFNGLYDPVVVSMTGSQMRKSRAWITRLTTERIPVQGRMIQPPMFFRAWHMTTVPESNEDGAWFGWKIEPGPVLFSIPRGRDVYLEARSFGDAVSSGEVKSATPVDETAGAEDGGRTVDGTAGDADPPY